MKKAIIKNPFNSRSQSINDHSTISTIKVKKLASSVFNASSTLDPVCDKGKSRRASQRIGGVTDDAASMMRIAQHRCPWQLYKGPDGKMRLERFYTLEEEPLTNFMIEKD